MISTCCRTIRREFIQALRISLGEFTLDDDVLAFEITEFRQLPDERRNEKSVRAGIEKPDSERLLRPRRARPGHRQIAKRRDELTSPHGASKGPADADNLAPPEGAQA